MLTSEEKTFLVQHILVGGFIIISFDIYVVIPKQATRNRCSEVAAQRVRESHRENQREPEREPEREPKREPERARERAREPFSSCLFQSDLNLLKNMN